MKKYEVILTESEMRKLNEDTMTKSDFVENLNDIINDVLNNNYDWTTKGLEDFVENKMGDNGEDPIDISVKKIGSGFEAKLTFGGRLLSNDDTSEIAKDLSAYQDCDCKVQSAGVIRYLPNSERHEELSEDKAISIGKKIKAALLDNDDLEDITNVVLKYKNETLAIRIKFYDLPTRKIKKLCMISNEVAQEIINESGLNVYMQKALNNDNPALVKMYAEDGYFTIFLR